VIRPRCPGTPHRGHTVPGEPCPLDRPQLEPPDATTYRSPFLAPGHAGPHLPSRTPPAYVNPHPRDLDHLATPRDPDRPRYRVLATPWYDHNHSGRYPADACEPAGWELEVARVPTGVNPYHLAPLGVTQTTGAALDPAAARRVVVNYLHVLAEPRWLSVEPADVELWVPLDRLL
jgi:hypothetical protein